MAILIGMSESVRGKTYDIAEERTAIGRNSTNILVFENETISGRHCVIEREGKRFKIRDLGSTNGTRVNSRDIQEAELKPKDLVQIGSMEFLFDAHDDEIENTQVGANTSVQVAPGPAVAPESFSSISPFGSRRDSQRIWYFLIGFLGVLALVVVLLFIHKLLQN